MSDYPDPDEEFDLLYADELDALREHEEPEELCKDSYENGAKSRRSLDFSSPALKKTFGVPEVREKCDEDVNNGHKDLNISGVQEGLSSPSKDLELNESGVNKLLDDADHSQSQKRNLDDIFGDIGDINFDDIEAQPYKKIKVDKDTEDELLINKIRSMRQQKQQLGLPNTLLARDYTRQGIKYRDRISFTVPQWPCITVTRSDGYKLYLGLRDEEFMEKEMEEISNCNLGFKNLLGSNFKTIWNDAKQYLEDKSTKKIECAEDSLEVNVDDNNSQLWVERYKPHTYFELLSDESTNRSLLHWLKMWDKVVFNREVKVKQTEVKNSFNKRSGKFEFGYGKRKDAEPEWETPFDEHGRPRKLISLLCGPPGAGKTTLAHLLARHAGYKVVEINASDDRNVEAFKTALENATQMKSVLDSEKRPNCLILDEIDGAPLPAIEFLIKFISGSTAGKAKKGQQKTKVHILRRPILCICNDPYAPALRSLRQVALVLHVTPPGAMRLCERLAEVASREGIPPDPPLLAALGERTNRDIRACLAVLHFCKLKGKRLKLADLQSDKLSIGMKDLNKSLFQVWQEVFQVQGEESNRARRLLSAVHSAGGGDYDKLVSGVFENYLEMKMKDSRLTGICMALDWFLTYDVFSSFIMQNQNYSLMSYLPYSFLCWHLLFATLSWPNIKFPSQGFQMFQRQNQLSGIITGVQKGVCAQIKPYCSRYSLLLDLMSFLPHIISPTLRPVNIQLYTEREQRTLSSLVGLMLDYNLQYTQQKLPDGNYHYLLDPDIITVGIFDEKTANVRNLTYSMKQLIAREVELERIRRTEEASGTALKRNDPRKQQRAREEIRDDEKSSKPEATAATSTLPNHLQRLQPKKMKTDAPLVMKDFFGRTITCSPATAAKKMGRIGDIVKSPIWYHYKEGFNNAVRRDVKISDLL